MQKRKYLKRIIGIVMLLCLVVLGNFVMKAMVTTEESKMAAEETEIGLTSVETETQLDDGELTVEAEKSGVQYEYDKLNRLTKVIYADGSTVSYEYDKNGNIVNSVVNAVSTSTPEATIEPTVEPTNEVTVYYANSSWTKAYVHYKVDGKWTTTPGKQMEETTEVSGYTWKYTIDLGSTDSVTLMFTDGEGTWDKNSDGNKYVLSTGIYGIKDYTVSSVTEENTTTVYYANSSWSKAYVHYKVDGKWTTAPGKLMEETTEVSGYTWKYTINLGSTDSVTLIFTDGEGTWDKNSDGNKYVLSTGVYGIKDYTISSVTDENITTVYYANSSWSKAYVHYKVDGKWTTAPGKLMEETTEVSGYTWKYTINLGSTDSVTLIFTDGEGTWDKNSDGNKYVLSTGTYGIKDYKVISLSATE